MSKSSPRTFDTLSTPLPRRLRDGLERLALVLRSDQWSAAESAGLNPTQAHVLTYLAGRGEIGMRVRAIADHLGVSQPTATDSIQALQRKGLVRKQADPADVRATMVSVTEAGFSAVRVIGLATLQTDTALAGLSADDQTDLLRLLIKLIRNLQLAGAIPAQRSCVSCRYFQPHAHASKNAPHHCQFVNAAFGDRHLRLDCNEHEVADPARQTVTWKAYAKGPAPHRAKSPT